MLHVLPRCWHVPWALVHRAVLLCSLSWGHVKRALRQKEDVKGGEGRRESPASLQTLVGSTPAGWLVCPVDLALCFSYVGEVLHGFQKEGGIWACPN